MQFVSRVACMQDHRVFSVGMHCDVYRKVCNINLGACGTKRPHVGEKHGTVGASAGPDACRFLWGGFGLCVCVSDESCLRKTESAQGGSNE